MTNQEYRWDLSPFGFNGTSDQRISQALGQYGEGVETLISKLPALDAAQVFQAMDNLDTVQIPLEYLHLSALLDTTGNTPTLEAQNQRLLTAYQEKLNKPLTEWAHRYPQDQLDTLKKTNPLNAREIKRLQNDHIPTPTEIELTQQMQGVANKHIQYINSHRVKDPFDNEPVSLSTLISRINAKERGGWRPTRRKELMDQLRELAPTAAQSLEQATRLRLRLNEERGVDPVTFELSKHGLTPDLFEHIKGALCATKGYDSALATMRRNILGVSDGVSIHNQPSVKSEGTTTLTDDLIRVAQIWQTLSPDFAKIILSLIANDRIRVVTPNTKQISCVIFSHLGPFVLVRHNPGDPDNFRVLSHELAHAIHFWISYNSKASARHALMPQDSILSESIASFGENLANYQFSPSDHGIKAYNRLLQLHNLNYRMGLINFHTRLLERAKDSEPFTPTEILELYRQANAEFGVVIDSRTHYAYQWLLDPRHMNARGGLVNIPNLFAILLGGQLTKQYLQAKEAKDLDSFALMLSNLMQKTYPTTLTGSFSEIGIDMNDPNLLTDTINDLTLEIDNRYKQLI